MRLNYWWDEVTERFHEVVCRVFGHAQEMEKMNCFICTRCRLVTRYK
jgi:CRISPR/Cas system CSM-associated protein Csm3 (group 7 of RAMP superfamily)